VRFDNRAEWLEFRRSGIGASDVPAILGLSKWASPWSVWAEKVGLLPDDDTDGNYKNAGRYLELAIAPWVTDLTGLAVDAEQDVVQHPTVTWAFSTVDGILFDAGTTASAAPVGNLESKTREPGPDVPPTADIVAQVRWQQFCGGYERTLVAILRGRRLDLHWIERDPDDIAWIYGQVERFWNEHVLTGTPPEVDSSEATTAALAAVYGTVDEGSVLDLDPDQHAQLIDGWLAAKQAKRDAEEVEAAYSNALRAVLGEHEVGLLHGRKVVSWKSQTARKLDVAAIRANHPRIARKYETTTTSRVLRNHTPKES